MNIIPTIMMGNIDIVFPAIHIMNKFIGICFRGANATSQDFCKINYCNNLKHNFCAASGSERLIWIKTVIIPVYTKGGISR